MVFINYLMFIVKNILTYYLSVMYNRKKGGDLHETKTIAKNELFSTYCT